MEKHTKKIAILGMLTSLSLIIFMIESMIQPLIPVPGVKIGLANIITMLVLLYFSPVESFFVLLVRVIIGSIFAGQIVSFTYSITGGILCIVVMTMANKFFGRKNIMITSVFGGIFHNIGQFLVAFFVLELSGMVVYLPVLTIGGVVAGIFTGMVTYLLLKYFDKILKISGNYSD